MNKEEIIDLLDRINHLSKVDQAKLIWNAAIDSAAESAKPVGSNSAPVGTIYKYDPKSNRCYWVYKESITYLKFKTDEK